MKFSFLSNLLMGELADLFNEENQMVKALPKMAKASRSPVLKTALMDHLEVTKDQINRLQVIFNNTRQNFQGVTGKTVKGIIEDGEELVNELKQSPHRDAAIISVMQRVQRYEIDEYLSAREHADDLGHTRIVELLNETLNEERALNLYLNELAQGMIITQAIG